MRLRGGHLVGRGEGSSLDLGVDASGHLSADADGPEVDLGDLAVLPGLVDAHVHLQFTTPEALLTAGVTAVRDLGSPRGVGLAQARAGAALLRVRAAGQVLTAPGGYPGESWGADGTAREVASADDAERAVAEQVDGGACGIKVALEDSRDRPVLSDVVLAAVRAAAHRAGLRVVAHVGSARALESALEVGVEELCHLPLHRVDPRAMARAAAAGVVLVPTLAIRGDSFLGRRAAARAVAAFREAGGRVVYGTDLGNAGTAPGVSVAEVELLLRAGMSGLDVLDAMTAGAGAHVGPVDAGRLELGARADVVGVDGDPLADPSAYGRVRFVLAAGQVVLDRR